MARLFRDCDLNGLDPCTVVAIRPCKRQHPVLQSDADKTQTRTYEFHIHVGGPDPCACGDRVKEMAYLFEPDTVWDVALIREGEAYTDPFGETFVCSSVTITQASSDCRTWLATATFDNTCGGNAWYKINGELITNIEDILEAACRITTVSEDEKVPAQLAKFRGLYDGRGTQRICTFDSSSSENGVCYPLEKMKLGGQYPPMNTAGVAFVPGIEKDEGDLTLIISKPYTAVNGCQLRKMRNRINCDPFRLCEYTKGKLTFGMLVNSKCARIKDINMESSTFCDGTPLKIVHVKVAIRRNVIETIDDDGEFVQSEDFGWDDLIANKGFAELKKPGDPDGFGGLVKEGNDKVGSSPLVEILDKEGQPISEAAWLGCKGQSLKTEASVDDDVGCLIGLDPDRIGYMRWQKYLDMVFMDDFNIPGFPDTVFFFYDPEDPLNEEDFPPGWFDGSSSAGALGFECVPVSYCDEPDSSGE